MNNPISITPEQAEKILTADFRNVAKKVAQGKTLTTAERDLIRSKAANCDDSLTDAKNFEELADLLGVSVRTINRWRKLEGAPEAMPGGALPLIEWRQFIRERNLGGQVSPQSEALKARKLLAEIEDRELKVALKKGLYVLKAEVEAEWFRRFAVLKNLLYSKLTLEVPPLSTGKDAVAIQQINQDALDSALMEAR